MLAFNIVQFFPLLNHQLLSLILDKVGFDCKALIFFKNYLVSRKTKYLWNSFSSPLYNIDIGISQESALFPILLALYLSPIFYIFEKYLKYLKIPISILFFVDNGLFISQHKSILVLNANLYCSYNIISILLTKSGLIIKHGKTEVFHFSRVYRVFNPPHLDLISLGGSVLLPKTIWQYLGFFFNQKLFFQYHINVRNRPASELVTLKVCNVKLSFDIWLVLYMYFILYS